MAEDGGNVFVELRNRLLRGGQSQAQAASEFDWLEPASFNWARDYFDRIAVGNDRIALRRVDDAGNDQSLSHASVAHRSDQVAGFLMGLGVHRGDRMLVMLGNVVALWETMLAAIKLGAVIIPATTLLPRADLEDCLARGHVRAIVADEACVEEFDGLSFASIRIAVRGSAAPTALAAGWQDYAESESTPPLPSDQTATAADALLLLYFTSGTTAKPKMVAHTHTSYPVGHLSTAYWIGLRPGDVHLNLSSPGWAKHAWLHSSRRGTPRPRCWRTNLSASRRRRCSIRWYDAGSQRFVRRPQSGVCSSRKKSHAGL